ncbi:MAG TPA: hypothetical protein VF914_00640 [Chloroflexia bacterium]
MSLSTVALVLSLFSPARAATVGASAGFGDPIFEQVWNHTDKPVREQVVARSWMWGAEPFHTSYEPHAEGPGGQHLVTYFDKSRMEINDPTASRDSEWFVTNGLLVVDMVSGRVQTGDRMFAPATPAYIPVAGDTSASVNAPTYAALAKVASTQGDNRAPNRTGQPVREYLARTGSVGGFEGDSHAVKYGVYEPQLGHNIADVFWTFMNAKGVTYHDGRYVQNDLVVDWLFAMGYPITEPYWIEVSVNGTQRWVLMQAFQRRILTYSPDNPEGWQVEMGNVGRAYFDWRYNQAGQPAPTATATRVPTLIPTLTPTLSPTPVTKASITIDPGKGDVNTQIMVYGRNFPAHSAVSIGVEKPSANYARSITTLAARADGTFEVRITLPGDAVQLDEVTITATANAGAVKATQTFKLAYNPKVSVTPDEVVINGSVRVQGEGFPGGVPVSLGMLLNNGQVEWLASANADRGGYFNAVVAIRNKPVGFQFRIVAATDGGSRATSQKTITVIGQPGADVYPASGPAEVNVSFSGWGWPARRALYLGLRVASSQTESWLPNPITTDGQGSFSTQVWVGREYAPYTEVRLIVVDGISTVRLEVPYRITRLPTATPTTAPTFTPVPPTATPVPGNPRLSVYPDVLAVGQAATATGSRWPAGASVYLALSRTGSATAEQALGVAYADYAGNFSYSFVPGPQWKDGGQLILTAAVPGGPSASVPVRVAAQSGRIVPAGLPMAVYSLGSRNGPVTYKARAEGWPADSIVNISVVSADDSLNAQVGSATVKYDGTFNVAFSADAAWRGRSDLGVRAGTADGRYYSLRYLPFTEMVKISGSGNMYQATGQGWPANTKVVVALRLDGESEEVIGSALTDAEGRFSLQVSVPRMPDGGKNEVEIRATDQPYSAAFDL